MDNKNLIKRILNLNQNEKEYILKLFISKNIQYTKNINGYFFNLSLVDNDFLNSINNSIELIEKNRNVLNDIDKNRDLMLKQCKELIENKLNYSIKLKQNDYIKKIKKKEIQSNIHLNFYKIKSDIYNLRTRYTNEIESEKIVYNKLSVYFRIYEYMKQHTRENRKTLRVQEMSNYNDTLDESNNNKKSEIKDDITDIDTDDIIDDIIDDDNNEAYSDIDESDNENEKSNDESDSDCNSDEKLYFKQLLNTHGFNFNNDNLCKLVQNEYII
jgi:hypothetical protein